MSIDGAKLYRDAYEEAAAKYKRIYDEAAPNEAALDNKITTVVKKTDSLEDGFSLVDSTGLKMDMSNTNAIETKKAYASKVITTVATTVGSGAVKIGLGAKVVSHAAGAYFYSTELAKWGTLGATRVGQYLLANTASAATTGLVSMPVVAGISVGTAATAIAAIGTGYGILKVGGFIYNHTIAKTPAEQINTDITPFVKKTLFS